jgi:hypothetical protein
MLDSTESVLGLVGSRARVVTDIILVLEDLFNVQLLHVLTTNTEGV